MEDEVRKFEALGIKRNVYTLRAGAFTEDEINTTFTGRGNELRQLYRAAVNHHNVLLFGTYGIGKSFLLRHFLSTAARTKKFRVAAIYTPFYGRSEEDFLTAVAYALALSFKRENRDARSLYERISGVSIYRAAASEAKAEAGFIVKGGGSYTRSEGRVETSELKKPHLGENVDRLVKYGNTAYSVTIVGVDETDKRAPRDFNTLVREARYLFEKRGMILVVVGAPAFLSEVTTSEFGAFDERVEVPPMGERELVEMAQKYSALADGNPFEKGALQEIASFAFGVPRIMMMLCAGAVNAAANVGLKYITADDLDGIMKTTGATVYRKLTPAQRRVIDYIHSRGGELWSVDKKTTSVLGVTKQAVYQHLDSSMRADAIAEVEERDGRVWRLNPAVSAYLKRKQVGVKK
jgi:hypothetical protein